jgi:hypothetical protein
MKTFLCFFVLTLLSGGAPATQAPGGQEWRFPILRRDGAGFAIEFVSLADGQVKVFQGSEVLSILMAYSAGQSGDLIESSKNRILIAQRTQGELRIRVRNHGQADRALPPVSANQLRRFDLRVNVTGKFVKKAFFVRGETAEIDETGPVIDLFGGRIPLGDDDYAITLETSLRRSGTQSSGSAPLEYFDYLFTTARTAGGPVVTWVVDFGAGSSVAARSFLPSTIKVDKGLAAEYSTKGKRMVDYAVQGAGGPVSGLMTAALPDLQIGDIAFFDVRVDVVDELPPLGGRPVAGIMGLDLLGRASSVLFSYDAEPPGRPILRLADRGNIAAHNVAEIPFSLVATHVMIRGQIGTKLIYLVLDTGSPTTILPAGIADASDLQAKLKPGKPIHGLDGKEIAVKSSRIGTLSLNNHVYSKIDCEFADLPIFDSYGLQGSCGLLGNSFLRRFRSIEVDFRHSVLRLTM